MKQLRRPEEKSDREIEIESGRRDEAGEGTDDEAERRSVGEACVTVVHVCRGALHDAATGERWGWKDRGADGREDEGQGERESERGERSG